MSKDKDKEDLPMPGDDEIRELDQIAEGSIPNRHEIVQITSTKANRTVSITRDQVYKYASVLANNAQIANLLGIERETLVKHFSRELTMARAFAKQKLLTRIYHNALHGNSSAERIFALKNWAGMTDNGLAEDLDEVEEGVEFVVRRPTKPMEREFEMREEPAIVADEDNNEAA